MNLVGYTATALSRNDIEDTPTNKNVVDFAIVELKDLQGNLVVMYDDAEGANPETQKTCDTNGQVTFFAEIGDYDLEINGKAQRINLAANIADYIKLGTGESVQEFADSFALKIFQSPTDGGLTEIQTRTVNANEVYEVRKTSDDSLATIYSDAAGVTEISQNGTDNKSGSDGVIEFYIADGDYYITVDSVRSDFSTSLKTDFDNIEEAVNYTRIGALLDKSIKVSEYHSATGYGGGDWRVILTSSLTTEDFAVESVANSAYSLKAIPLAGPADIYLHQFGVWLNDKTNDRDLQNATLINSLIEKDWIKSIRLPDSRVYHRGEISLKSGLKIHGGGPRNSVLHNTATSGNAISGIGAGIDLPDAITNQTVMSGVVLRDFLSDSDGNDENGIVLDIARNCVMDNVWSFNHGADQYHLGTPCDDSISTNDKNDLLTLTNGYAFGGVNGYYFGSMSGITLQHLLSNGYSDYGVVIEDCGIFNFNDSNIGSGLASAKDAVIVRNSTSNTSNARATTTVNINKVHSEQLKSGYGLCRIAMTGTTKAISVNISGCDQYPINADYVILEGVTEDCSIDGNGLVQSTAADGGSGIVIGNKSIRTSIGKLRWRNNLVNIQDNAPSDGTIYWDRNLENQIFYLNDIAASAANQNMSMVPGSSVVQFPVSSEGNLLGAQVRISNPITQGSIEVNIVKNGTEIPFSATLTSASQNGSVSIPRGAIKLDPSDLLVCRVTSSSDLLPNNAIDILCNLKMEISRQ